jgi:hypothetical protein
MLDLLPGTPPFRRAASRLQAASTPDNLRDKNPLKGYKISHFKEDKQHPKPANNNINPHTIL